MKIVKKSQMNLIGGGSRAIGASAINTAPTAGPKEEIAIGFLRACGAFLFKVIIDIFSQNDKKDDNKKEGRHSFHDPISSAPSFGGYSF